MKKNVIYTIDCQYEDEWHKKTLAKQKFLKDRLFMTDEHVESIFDSIWYTDDQLTWSKTTKYYLQKYADKIDADLIILNSNNASELNLPDCWSNYQRSNLLKFYALKEFQKSNYEKFLCLDLDILILLNSPSIFDSYESGFYMHPDDYYLSRENIPIKLKKHFNIEVSYKEPKSIRLLKDYSDKLFQFQNETLYNGGVIFCDKLSAEKICRSIPDNKDWFYFLKEYNLEKNPRFKDGDQINDQDFIQVFLRKSNVKAKPLGIEWNCTLDLVCDHITGYQPTRYNFIHFFGNQSEFNVRKLLPFLNQKRSLRWIKNLYLMLQDKDIELPKPGKTLFD